MPLEQPRLHERNKRKAARVAIDDSLVFHTKNQHNSGGFLCNVSEGGLFFVSDQDIAANSEVVFYVPIKMGRKKRLCLVTGNVVRRSAMNASQFGYGVQFQDKLESNARALIHDYVVYKTTGFLPDRTTPGKAIGAQVTDKIQVRAFAAPKKKPIVKTSLWRRLLMAMGLATIFAISFFAIRSIFFNTSISNYVPIVSSEVNGETLHAKIDMHWLATTPLAVRQENLRRLYHFLRTQGIHSALFTNSDGTKVAALLQDINAPESPRIDLRQ